MKKAVVLLSGGLDSATTLWLARKNHETHCLVFDYAQRHSREISTAKKIAALSGSACRIVKLRLPETADSLTSRNKPLPLDRRASEIGKHIPSTYVPARNIIFLSFALSYAEVLRAQAIFIGANAVDFSGYPDCTPAFLGAFRRVMKTGVKPATAARLKLMAPLLYKTKKQIVLAAKRLGVPIELTWSCYGGGKKPCGRCDSCIIRKKAFREAGMKDPAQPS